jgi:two-component system response regulator YesN
VIKLIIVDDDAVERFSLRNYINWSIIGVEVVGDAWNGMQAIDLAMSLKPDIILSDIKMPVMDGLDMAKKIKAIEPNTKIILCSAHDDFTYAREAVNLNVFGYILKPVRDEELLVMVKKAADKCIEERMHGAIVEKLKNNVKVNFSLMRESIVHELLFGDSGTGEDVIRNAGLDWILETGKANGLLLIRWPKNSHIPSERIKELEKALFSDGSRFIHLKLSLNELVILIQTDETEMLLEEHMDALSKQAEVFLNANGEAEVCVVSASSSSSDNGFKALLSDANDKIELRWARMVLTQLDGARNFRNKPISNSAKMEISDISNVIFKNELSNAFRDADETGIRASICKYFDQVFTTKSTSADWYEQGLIVLSTIVTISREGGYNPFSGIDEEINHWTMLLNMKSLESIQEHLVKCAVSIIKSYTGSTKDKTDFIIGQIERIVEKHYNEPLTVEQIASMLHFSPNYLGVTYKTKRNISISQYITKFRICKSMELLRGFSYSIVDISQMCGYENIPYFHTMFKKYIGITPNQYRQMIKWTPGDSTDV